MKRKVKGILGVVLSIAMIVSLTPGMVFAAEETDLLADMYVGSKGNDVVTADLNQPLTVTAELDVQPVKDALKESKDGLPAAIDPSAIQLSKVKAEFKVELTADEGLTLPTTPTSYALNTNLFVPKSVSGTTLTLGLKDNYTTFSQLDEAISALESPLTLTIDGVMPTVAGKTLALTGKVDGSLQATASVLGATQNIDKSWTGKKFGNPEIKITVYAAKALDGDLLVEGDTEASNVYVALPGKSLNYSATLDVSPVKDRMKAIEEQFANADTSKVTIDPFNVEIKAEFKPDEGLTLSTNKDDYKLSSGSEAFQIAVEGNTVTFTLSNIKTYDDLKAVADSLDDELILEFPVDVAEDATGLKTLKGTINGSMTATAKYNSQTRDFNEAWTAAQKAGGTDYIIAGGKDQEGSDIQATIKVASVLEGDLKIGDNTENDDVIPATAGTTLNYQAVLGVQPIRELMKDLEAQYKNAASTPEQIKLDPITSEFTVEFTVPEGLSLSENKDDYKLNSDAFKVTVEGNTVTFTLSDVKDYAGLKAIVDALSDELTLDFPVEIATTASGRKTLVGKVTGTLKATASYNNKTLGFDEAWAAVQTEEGLDAILKDGDDKDTIQITIDVKSALNQEDHFNYIIGYPDGNFLPNGEITRAEVATIFYRLLKEEVRTSNESTSNSYPDVEEGAWYNKAISTISKAGLVIGYEDGTFRPNDKIRRAELATIISRFEADNANATSSKFTDIEGHWAKQNIIKVSDLKYFIGYTDSTEFKPDNYITRAETVTAINRALGRAEGIDGSENALIQLSKDSYDMEGAVKFDDNTDTSAWYYAAVQEAANNHEDTLAGKVETWTKVLTPIDWAAQQL